MNTRHLPRQIAATSILALPFLVGAAGWAGSGWLSAAQDKKPPRLATRSSPIAITADDAFVWSVNPDNDSVSVFNVANDVNAKVAEIAVGRAPWCVAITPEGDTAYV